MRVQLEMRGTSPLVMHNVSLADPANPVVKAIGSITDKGSAMSDDDRLEVARLEFFGGMYLGRGGPVIPVRNILRTVANAAKVRRLGKDVERAMIPTTLDVPLVYKGPRDVEALWKNESFRYSDMVRVGRGLVSRMRPRFPDWSVVSEWELLTEVLNFRDFTAIAEVAGMIEGLGDNRRNGYGRFISDVKELKAIKSRPKMDGEAMEATA